MTENNSAPRPLVILGPTAAGKTEAAIAIMRHNPTYVAISADSMTVYKEMNIGTAKPDRDELGDLPYRLCSVVSVIEEFSLSKYLELFNLELKLLRAAGETALVTGGSALYVRAIVDQLRPPQRYLGLQAWLERRSKAESDLSSLFALLRAMDFPASEKIDSRNARRIVRALEVCLGSGNRFSDSGPGLSEFPASHYLMIGICPPWGELEQRMRVRIADQLAAGWVEEAAEIANIGPSVSRTAEQAVGYRELIQYVRGEISLDEASEAIFRRTRRFAKRQMAWFRRDPRIQWVVTAQDAFEVAVLATS